MELLESRFLPVPCIASVESIRYIRRRLSARHPAYISDGARSAWLHDDQEARLLLMLGSAAPASNHGFTSPTGFRYYAARGMLGLHRRRRIR